VINILITVSHRFSQMDTDSKPKAISDRKLETGNLRLEAGKRKTFTAETQRRQGAKHF
jgi:hypothetical protein